MIGRPLATIMLSPLPPRHEALNTHRKAQAINLDESRYGTFAEIGAGQEVARWFFRVGGAAGTIAKSMSAYDMAVSDAVYGHTERYVSRERLQSMLDYEHEKNVKRLSAARGDTTAFFVFADTVAARGFRNTKDCHGWMGLKLQSHPRDQESQIVLHVRMLDREANAQQEALGVVGVNLLYGAFFLHHEPEQLVESLLDNLSTHRVEIDMIEFSGIEFRTVDNRLMSLKLVELGLSPAAMFDAKGVALQPTEVLHRKPVLIQRGTFRPVTKVNIDMLRGARKAFAQAEQRPQDDIVEVMEIALPNLRKQDGSVNGQFFLARADMLGAAGKSVMISDYYENYRLATYLRSCTSGPIALVLGAGSLQQLFDEKYYADLDGGILEGMGRLFGKGLRIFVYPMLETGTSRLVSLANLDVPPALAQLFAFLRDRGSLVALDDYDPTLLPIHSPDVLHRIEANDGSWEAMVPAEIAEMIKRRGFFGYGKGR
jgi:hypothetical protein